MTTLRTRRCFSEILEIDWKTLRLSPRPEALPKEPLWLRTLTVRYARVAANRRLARVNKVERSSTSIANTRTTEMWFRSMNSHESEKATRLEQQGWEALKDNPAFEVAWKRRDTVFRTELPNTVPLVREGIEHV
ncbi:hypothetical protein PsorP6_010881 [Peronosclerospora sorghi]|uniref:Uncharacterized protein n=1 Tax=Peronosclerospora sorghi TaxID=230839 RepID=A0ACC0VUZ6_9STRA|nr:hypothetical protein PsorP6_010881 [Peronosclerospora sorghi]